MDKKGQLGFIEMKFFLIGLVIGVIAALVVVYLGSTGVLPFHLICAPAAA